jgi:firmicute plasmid replication protein (repL)
VKTVTKIIFIICRIKNSDKFFKKCIKIYIFSPFVLISGGDFMTNFFMVPNEVFDLNLKPQQFAVLCYILKCCDESNTCYPSIHTIAEACAISDNTVRESIKFLCKRKIITKSGGFTVGKYGKIQSSSYLFSINPNFYDEGFGRDNLVEYYKNENSATS